MSITDDQPLGVALIGAGMIAPSHIKALSEARDLALAAVVSRRPERAAHLAALYDGPVPRFTADLDAVAADPSIHMAIVATPPSVRHEVIATLAQAGKHILLEKPVGRSVAEAEAVVALCQDARVTLGVLFQHRMRAPSRDAARLVAQDGLGGLGRLGLVEIAVPLWRDQSYYDELGRGTYARDGGGVMITNAIHSIDLALSLTGPVTRVRAMVATTPLHRMEAEDFAVAGLEFACGAVGSFVASTAMFPHRTEVITLHFENASMRLDKDALEVTWRDGRRSVETASGDARQITPQISPGTKSGTTSGNGGTGVGKHAGKHVWHRAVIEDFARAIRAGHAPMVTGRAALASQRLIAAIEASSRSGAPVDIAP